MNPAAVLQILITASNQQAMAKIAQTDAAMKRSAATAQSAASATAASYARTGQTLSRVGSTMTKYISVPAAAVGVASVKMAKDFNDAMMQIHTSAGASTKEVRRMHDAILALARSGEVEQGPKELAQGLFHIESQGFRSAKALTILKAAAQGADVGNASLEDTTRALGGVMKALHAPASQATAIMSQLIKIVGQGDMRMEELVSALSTGVVPAAKTFGLSLRDVGAALDVMTQRGMGATQSATRLRMTFSMLAAPTDAAKAALASIGLSADELATTMREKNLPAAIALLARHLEGVSKTRAGQVLSEAFGGGRTSAAIMLLVQNVGDLRKAYAGAGQDVAGFNAKLRADAETTQSKLNVAWAQIQAAMISVGESLGPVVAKMAQLLAVISKLAAAIPYFAELLVAAFVAGPIIKFIGWIYKLRAAYLSLAAAQATAAATGAAGGAGAVGGIGAAAGGGLLASLAKFAKGAGLVAAGVAVADAIGGAIKTRFQEKSDDIWTALKAKGKTPDILGLSAADLGLGFLDQSLLQMAGLVDNNRDKANKLLAMLQQVARTRVVTPEQVQQIWQLANALGLTAQQAAKIRQIVEPAAAAFRTFSTGVGTALNIFQNKQWVQAWAANTGKFRQLTQQAFQQVINWAKNLPPAMRAQVTSAAHAAVNAFALMHKGAHGHIKALADSANFEMKKLRQAIASGKDPIPATIRAYQGYKSAIQRAMKDGTISVRQGTKLINQLLIAQMKMLGLQGKPPLSVLPPLSEVNMLAPQAPPGGQKGMIVPGSGSGDKVPLHIGGRLAAMVEPNELVSVANRNATAALMGVNQRVPRFARGGQFTGASPGVIDDIAAGALNIELTGARQFLAAMIKKYGAGNVAALLREAKRMEALKQPYVWGGGHAGFSRNGPWDCSGAVSQLLHGAGYAISAPMVSGAFMRYGLPGLAQGNTGIWANPAHVWATINGQGFSTSAENPGGGWGSVSYNSRPGFVKRHGVSRTTGQAAAKGSQLGGIIQKFAKGGQVMGASSYGFGESGTGTVGASGKSLIGKLAFAELGMGRAMGHLPFGARKLISYHGKSATGVKLDIGLGGPAVKGHPRKIDLWKDLANKIGFGNNLDLVKVSGVLGKKAKLPKRPKTSVTDPEAPPWTLSLPAGYSDSIRMLLADAEKFGTFAQRASDFGMPLGGLDEIGWLTNQLGALQQVREVILAAIEWVNRVIARFQKEIDKAQEQIQKFKQGKQTGDKRNQIEKLQANIKKWKEHREITRGLLSGDEGLFSTLNALQEPLIDPAMRFKRGINLFSTGVQGQFGGSIGEVQSSLKTAGVTAAEAAATKAAEIATAGYGTFDLPIPLDKIIPGFAEGGVVPGPFGKAQLILAHGGEVVLPMQAGGIVGYQAGGEVSQVENLDAIAALAGYTPGLQDDIAAWTDLVSYWTQEYNRLKSIHAPLPEIASAAQSLRTAQTTLWGFQEQIWTDAIQKLITDAEKTPQLTDDVAAYTALFNFWSGETERLKGLGAPLGPPTEMIANAITERDAAESKLKELKVQPPDGGQMLSLIEMHIALAGLTEDTADDIAAYTELVAYWTGELARLQKIVPLPVAEITSAASALSSAQGTLKGLTEKTGVSESTAGQDWLKKQLVSAQRAYQVSQAQYTVLRNTPAFGGSFAGGGIVPGPMGAPRMILAHGGEAVGQPGNVRVIINGDIINTPRGKDPVEVVIGDRRFSDAVRNVSGRRSVRPLQSSGGLQ